MPSHDRNPKRPGERRHERLDVTFNLEGLPHRLDQRVKFWPLFIRD
jgi:hypothetical protein